MVCVSSGAAHDFAASMWLQGRVPQPGSTCSARQAVRGDAAAVLWWCVLGQVQRTTLRLPCGCGVVCRSRVVHVARGKNCAVTLQQSCGGVGWLSCSVTDYVTMVITEGRNTMT